MSDVEIRLECLKAAVATATAFEVLDVARSYLDFVGATLAGCGPYPPDHSVGPSESPVG